MSNKLKDYKSKDGTYIIPVRWSVYSTVSVEAENLEEACLIAQKKLEELPLCSEAEYIDESYAIDAATDDDMISAQSWRKIGDVLINKEGKIIKF